MDKQTADVDTAETLAGAVRLLRQAAVLAWTAADCAQARSPGQLLALGVDLAADEARHLVPDGTEIDGPVPVGDEPASLLRSAELLEVAAGIPDPALIAEVVESQRANTLMPRAEVAAGISSVNSAADDLPVAQPPEVWWGWDSRVATLRLNHAEAIDPIGKESTNVTWLTAMLTTGLRGSGLSSLS